MIKKILIANRGEIACRVIKTAKQLGIKTVAVFSEADKDSLFVSQADESYCIGKPEPSESYLNINKIISIAKKSKSDAIHPGYGFLSENEEFVKKLKKEKIIFIGPNPKAIKKMGDKIESKNLAIKLKLNVIPGHTAPVKNPKEALSISKKIGFPVLLKASAGGGGKGMRIVRADKELEENFNAARSESKNSFGDDRVFIEKYIEQPRHIEIQILCDKHGNQLHLGERECSIQRRYQKVIEECPSPLVDKKMRESMASQALKLAREVNYDSAGTVEFVVDSNKNFYFLEMNTRLQVEHPVTELVTGIDLVEQMIYCADNKKLKLKQSDIKLDGWSIESRIYAEDPSKDFLPSIGRISQYLEPNSAHFEGGKVRNDTGISPGSEISIYYDPMISKLAVHHKDRSSAIELMINSLQCYYLSGVENNIGFLISILNDKKFKNGLLTTNFIKDKFKNGYQSEIGVTEEIVRKISIASVLVLIKQLMNIDLSKNSELTVKILDQYVPIKIKKISFSNELYVVLIKINNSNYTLCSDWKLNQKLLVAEINDKKEYFKVVKIQNLHKINIEHLGVKLDVSIFPSSQKTYYDFMPKQSNEDLSRKLISPMPGLVKSVSVTDNQKIKSGEQLIIIEAMKMENILRSEKDCIVDKVLIKEGDSVSTDEELILFKK
tara:strand:- start:2485 stop:4479 length:1995 start_codon:yes stop_codon:yes gene_type:complete